MKYVIGVIIVLAILFGIQLFINNNSNQGSSLVAENSSATTTMDTSTSTYPMTTTSDGLGIQDIVVGTGTEAVAGKTVTVDYTGTFTDGEVFDSSIPRGQPFSFDLGAGQVIQGWEEGVVGMKVGGERKLVIPPSLGYGSQTSGPIPGNSTLLFDIKLLNVQ